MRQIVLDTETTGLEVSQGHRIIEIGCVELIDRRVTDNHWHYYINPDREIDAGAFEVHGISSDFLSDKHHFEEVSEDFLNYIKGAELVIHNAAFDVGFLNQELLLLGGAKSRIEDFSSILDTLVMARQKHPGQKNNLDALCKRYLIDNSHRSVHGALLDARILADVYLAMTGGQTSLGLDSANTNDSEVSLTPARRSESSEPLPIWEIAAVDTDADRAYVEFLAGQCEDAVWK
ncbi:MAG: DNA polymerase-3 subunit epsilon [Planctomycetota bacterium]|jgi:DNA polymerase-3 subunit epsilon